MLRHRLGLRSPSRVRADDRVVVGSAVGDGQLQKLVLAHLRAAGGRQTHAELGRWATTLGFDAEALDRCLVCCERSGLVQVLVGDPPCTATRVVALGPSGRFAQR
jgi:hypothetical protein